MNFIAGGKMSLALQTGTQTYKNVQAQTASPVKLIIMLYNGMIRFLKEYKRVVESKESGNGIGWIEKAHLNIFKTTRILQTLTVSLNEKEGGDIAQSLKTIYAYMYEKLIEADLNKSITEVEIVLNMLVPLRDAWLEVEKNIKL